MPSSPMHWPGSGIWRAPRAAPALRPQPFRPDCPRSLERARFALEKFGNDGQGTSAISSSKHSSTAADGDNAWALVHRLLTEQALGQWKRYAVAFTLMAIAA